MFSIIVELIVSIRETVVEKTVPYQVSKTRHFQTCRYVLKTPRGPHPPQLQPQSHLMEPRTKQCLQLECLRLLLLAYFFAYHFCWRELWNEHRYQAATLCFFFGLPIQEILFDHILYTYCVVKQYISYSMFPIFSHSLKY